MTSPALEVPWFVGEAGAEHPPEVARLVAYAASGGGEGIVGGPSLKVSQLSIPGSGVQVASGAAMLLNYSPGAQLQSYAAHYPVTKTVQVAATGSGSGRSDLIVLSIHDSQYEPWRSNPPANKIVGPYRFLEPITGVPAGIQNVRDLPNPPAWPAIALARIDIPASTGTITNAMITDLREMAVPRSYSANRVIQVNRFYGPGSNPPASPDWVDWPATWSFRIPKWANRLALRSFWSALVRNASFVGGVRFVLRLGTLELFSDHRGVDINWPGVDTRGNWTLADDMLVPTAMRGKVVTAALQILRSSGTGTLELSVGGGTAVVADLFFTEVAD